MVFGCFYRNWYLSKELEPKYIYEGFFQNYSGNNKFNEER